MPTTVVTANVESALDRHAAARCLDAALAERPDVLGLQEWRLPRVGLLRRHGAVHLAGTGRVLSGAVEDGARQITWVAPVLGDCVVGLSTERFDVERHGTRSLGGVRVADPGTRRPPLLPPRWVSVTEARDLQAGGRAGIVVFHLVPGSQARDVYRADRPRTTRRHRAESRELQYVVDRLLARCDRVWALGDSNFHAFALHGLRSAWIGHEGPDGTLGSHRRIDDVFATGPSDHVRLVPTESDHRMVVVRYAD